MEIQTVAIDKLRPHPQNPRLHPDSAIEKLVKSLKEYGFTNPILISEDNYVLAGHARLKAAEKAGLKEVPVITLPLKGSKALAYMIADNRLQDETDWDFTKLKDLLSELDTGAFDMEITGFDIKQIENLLIGGEIILDPSSEWQGMPEFDQQDKTAFRSIIVHFKDQEAVEEFERLINQKIIGKLEDRKYIKVIWFPKAEIEKMMDKVYKSES